MRYDWDDVILYSILWMCVLSVAVLIGMVAVYVPAGLRAEAKCLSMGYPKATVTYKLDAYCLNLNGTITVRVEPIKEKK